MGKSNTVLRGKKAQHHWVMRAIRHYSEGLAGFDETADQIISLFGRFVRMLPTPEQREALGAVLSNLDEVLMTDCERAEALIWAWEGMRAQGIEARQGGDVQQAPREAREPGPKDAPK